MTLPKLAPKSNLYRIALANMRLAPVVVFLSLITATLEGVGIGLSVPLLSAVMGETNAPAPGGLAGFLETIGSQLDPRERVMAIATIIFLLIAIKNVIAYINSVLGGYLYGKASHAIRVELAHRLITVGFAFFKQHPPGRLLNTLANESWRVSDAIGAILSMAVNACAAIILYIFLLALSWKLTLTVTAALLVIQAVHARLASRVKAPSRALSKRNGELAARMLHLVHAGQLIRAFGQEGREQQRFDVASDAVRREALQLNNRMAALAPLSEALYAGVFVAAIAVAWTSGVGLPAMVAFLALLYRLQPYVRSLQASINQLHGWSGALESVEWLLDESDKPAPPRGERAPGALKSGISFREVGFSYLEGDDERAALKDVSFDILPGRATALVGRSGSGKTTIVNLLFRLISPNRGQVLVDGVSLEDLSPEAWRARLALASQDLELVDGTVRENIAYGAAHATEEQVIEAARLAEAHGFISALQQGYDTLVGYRGVNLSAGQRQRIALARALVRNPDVLILDEATNAVDGLSEGAILATLKLRAGKSTTIVISHHRRTISVCDDVVILRNGRVAAQSQLKAVDALDMDELYELSQSA